MSWEYYGDPRPDIQAVVSVRGRRILDVGCGGGTLAAALKTAGAAFVAGVEQHADAAARARPLLDALVEGDLLTAKLSFAPSSFDYIIFADVLEHLPDPESALRRYLPLLAREGRIVVSVPNMRFYLVLLRLLIDRWSYTDSGIRDRTHLRVFTRRSLLALLESAGLQVERLARNYRFVEDQSRISRVGAAATHVVRAVAPVLAPDLFAFQYVAVARRNVQATA